MDFFFGGGEGVGGSKFPNTETFQLWAKRPLLIDLKIGGRNSWNIRTKDTKILLKVRVILHYDDFNILKFKSFRQK